MWPASCLPCHWPVITREAVISEVGTLRPHPSQVVLLLNTQHQAWTEGAVAGRCWGLLPGACGRCSDSSQHRRCAPEGQGPRAVRIPPGGPPVRPEWWPHSPTCIGKETRHRQVKGRPIQGRLRYEVHLPSIGPGRGCCQGSRCVQRSFARQSFRIHRWEDHCLLHP